MDINTHIKSLPWPLMLQLCNPLEAQLNHYLIIKKNDCNSIKDEGEKDTTREMNI